MRLVVENDKHADILETEGIEVKFHDKDGVFNAGEYSLRPLQYLRKPLPERLKLAYIHTISYGLARGLGQVL